MAAAVKGFGVFFRSAVLTLPFFFAAASEAAYPSDPMSDALRPDDRAKRWNRMPPEKKKRLIENYRYFSLLPDAERQRLKERHRMLEVIRESLDGIGDGPKAREENKAEMNRRVRHYLSQRENEFKRRFHQVDPKPEKNRQERMKLFRKNLERMNASRIGKYLDHRVREGLIPQKEAARFRSLPPEERRRMVFNLGKRRIVHELEGLLSPEEMNRLKELEPWRFHRWRHSEERRFGMLGPAGRLIALTQEQKAALETLPKGETRDQAKEAFFAINLEECLALIGVDPQTIQEVLSMPLPARQRWTMEKIRTLLHQRGELPQEIRKLLDPRSMNQKPPSRKQKPSGRNRRPPGRRPGAGYSPS